MVIYRRFSLSPHRRERIQPEAASDQKATRAARLTKMPSQGREKHNSRPLGRCRGMLPYPEPRLDAGKHPATHRAAQFEAGLAAPEAGSGRSQQPNLQSPQGSGAWLRAKSKRSLRPFKEQYNLVLLPYRAAQGEARHSGRVMRSLAAPESTGFLNRAGRASRTSTAAQCPCPRPPPTPPRARAPPRAREGFSMGEANEADHPLMVLGKTLRSFR